MCQEALEMSTLEETGHEIHIASFKYSISKVLVIKETEASI